MTVRHLVSNCLVDGSGETCRMMSPVDDCVIAKGRFAGGKEADMVAATADRAALAMSDLPIAARAAILRDLAARLEAGADAIAAAITMENGCPSDQARALQVGSAVGLLRAYADLVDIHSFEETRAGFRGGSTTILRHPVGPVLGIVPWNVPIFLACMKLAPTIAAGCPIVLKPSPESARSMSIFATQLGALDMPDGAIQSLIGGADLGRALVGDARFQKVSFTGSTAAGRQVGAAAAERMARITLELGGKSAAILLDDVDLSAVRDQLFLAMLQNNGQVCGAQSRLLIPATRASEIEDFLAEMWSALNVGNPREAGTDIGPVVSKAAATRIRDAIAADLSAGGSLLSSPDYPADGAFVPPSLIRPSSANADILESELFGPVVTVQRYDSEDDAVRMANAHRYGLSGSVWSGDTERASRLARRLKTGTVGINTKNILDFGSPFGGWRSSGIGRELGPEGIDAYTETTTLLMPSAE
ncbi:MAG: aldehyde dehydrogenase family protein [Pacificimonas sp.]